MTELSDHDLLLELRGDVKALREEVKELKDNVKTRIDDHEIRIRFIERWVWAAIGVVSVIEFVIIYWQFHVK